MAIIRRFSPFVIEIAARRFCERHGGVELDEIYNDYTLAEIKRTIEDADVIDLSDYFESITIL